MKSNLILLHFLADDYQQFVSSPHFLAMLYWLLNTVDLQIGIFAVQTLWRWPKTIIIMMRHGRQYSYLDSCGTDIWVRRRSCCHIYNIQNYTGSLFLHLYSAEGGIMVIILSFFWNNVIMYPNNISYKQICLELTSRFLKLLKSNKHAVIAC